jgi:CHASE2 domain-containing sensor protein
VSTDKLVSLKFNGDLDTQGFQVTLEIGLAGQRPDLEVTGFLPPDSELSWQLKQWQSSYRNLKLLTRIKPKKILYQGSIHQTETCQHRSLDLRDRFLQWLRSDSFQTIDRQLREALNHSDRIQVLLRTSDHQLWRLPWHTWDLIDRYPNAEIALSASTYQHHRSRPVVNKPNVRILAILGHAAGIDVAADRQLLQSLPDAEVQLLIEPQRQQLNDQLWEQSWDILFFAGHSQTEGEKGRIYINPTDSLTLAELKYGLRHAIAQGLQLAIFNSCDGLGLIHELEQLHLPQLIVMREPVPDQVAHAFLKHFLTAYANHDSLYLAERQARERLQGLEHEYPCASWLPVMYQHPASIPPSWQELKSVPVSSRQNTTTLRSSYPDRTQIKSRWRRSLRVITTSLLITGLIIGIRELGGLERWELSAYDRLVRLQPAEKQDDRLLIITIDDADIQYQEQQGMTLQGSLSDQALASLLEKLKPLQPRSIGLDLYRSGIVEYDSAEPLLFTICKVPAPEGGDPYGVNPPSNIPVDQIGFSDFVVDRDDVLRRHLLALQNPVPTSRCAAKNAFSLLLALHYLSIEQIPYHLTPDRTLQVGEVELNRLTANAGGYQNLDAAGYQMMLRYRAARSPQSIAQTLSLRQILESDFSPDAIEQLRDRIILIGVTAPSSSDQWFTPYLSAQQKQEKIPGVIMQAHLISQLLSAVLDERSLIWWWSDWIEGLWILTWALLGGLWAWMIGRSRLFWLTGAVSLIVLVASCYGCLTQAGWIPLVPSALALILTQIAGSQWVEQRLITRGDRSPTP